MLKPIVFIKTPCSAIDEIMVLSTTHNVLLYFIYGKMAKIQHLYSI